MGEELTQNREALLEYVGKVMGERYMRDRERHLASLIENFVVLTSGDIKVSALTTVYGRWIESTHCL